MTDISSFVTITSPAITKQYVQGTNLPLHNDLINLANSSTTPIVAAFQSVGGVSFTVYGFPLNIGSCDGVQIC